MKKKSGHILVIVIFILFLVSFMGLLVTKYVKNVLLFSSELHKYFKAYYIGYGGIEIALTQVKNHPFGFEETIESNSDTNSKNYKYCKLNKCYFELELKSKSNYLIDSPDSVTLNSCQEENSFDISHGEGLIVPLFWDPNPNDVEGPLEGTNVAYLSEGDFLNIKLNTYNSVGKKISIGVSIIEDLQRNIIQKSLTSIMSFQLQPDIQALEYDSNKKSFLVLGNVDSSGNEEICINNPVQKLPSKYVVINSVGRYNDRFVSIQAVKMNTLPDYLIYNILN